MKKYFIITTLIILSTLQVFCQDTLTIEDAIKTALENNFSIQIVKKDVLIAKNNNSFMNAGFLPELIATGSQDNSYSNTKQQLTNGTDRNRNGSTNSLSGSVMMNWTIFQGFNMFIAKNTLEELQDIEELETRMTIENTVASVIVVYYDIVSSQMKRQVFIDALKLSRDRKNLADYKLKLGSASMIDVYQASVDLNADSSALLQQEGVLRSLQADLNILLGREASIAFAVNDSLNLNQNINYQEILQKVQSQNSQVFLARKNLTLSELNQKYWKSQYFPSVTLYGGYNYINSRSDVNPITISNVGYGPIYGVRASFNIFNGFSNRRNATNARIQYQSSELQLKQAQLQAENDLYKVYTNYQTNLGLLNLEQNNLTTAKENLRIAAEKFRLGTIDNIELRITQQKLIDAENRYVNSLFQAKVAETELMRLSGEIWGQNQ